MPLKATCNILKSRLLLLIIVSIIASGILNARGPVTRNQEPLVVAFHQANITWNPLHSTSSTEAQIYTAIYEGLVSYHPLTLDPVPGVASSWEISEDGTVYTFELREDARYCNGDQVLAEHFRDSWLTLINPVENTDYSFMIDIIKNARAFRNGAITDPEAVGIKVLENNVLQVTLDSPAGHFLRILPHHSLAPVHPDFLELTDWQSQEIIRSNGPFRMTSKNPDLLKFTRNEYYWDFSNVETAELRIILSDDPEDLTRRFNNKEIHWTTNFIYNQLDNPQKTFVVNPQFATSYFYFNASQEPWDEPEVRKALNLLVGWEAIRTKDQLYLPTSRIVPSISGYPDVEGIEKQDIEKALTLLQKAGYPDGQGLPDPVIKILPIQEHRNFANAMKDAWKKHLGIDTQLHEADFETYYEDLDKRNYTLAVMGWIGDYPDPLTFLQMWVSDSNLNKGLYNNPEYDNLINKAIAASGSERYELLAKAERIILNESAVIPYKHAPAVNAVHLDSLQFWLFNPLDIHPFKYIRYHLPPLIPNTV